MFTGIIRNSGEVVLIERNQGGDTRMVIRSSLAVSLNIGDSIACNGACMTVVNRNDDWFAIEVSDVSLSCTTFGQWSKGTKINLERPLTLEQGLDGHLVTGHIDTMGQVMAMVPKAGSVELTIGFDPSYAPLIAPKGSITVDGVSLTVNTIGQGRFSVNLIPHTAQVTTLGGLKQGDKVNLEIDIIARYLKQLMSTTQRVVEMA